EHLGVLCSTVLRALPQEQPGFMRVQPHAVGVIRYEICLARQARHPEAVVGVRRKQCKKSGGSMCRVAYRNVQFIRSYDFERRISILPPELVPDDGDLNGI